MLKTFINRPVLSTVISILIVVLGGLGLFMLPVSQYPNIAPPTVRVTASYTGASADVVLKSVIVPLEEQINGVEGMTYMTSTATNDGLATINVFFKVGKNADQAAIDVQNRVSQATSLLPAEVTQTGVSVNKTQTSTLMMVALYSDNPAYDQTFLQNYANINLVPQIKRVEGVGDASAMGLMSYSMRVWLKPDVMASYGLVPSDITAALNTQNIEAAPGKFGENGGQSFQYAIRYTGKLKSVAEYGNIVIRATEGGQILRLKDVARIELGAQAYNITTQLNGKPTTVIAVSQSAGANATDVINKSKKILEEASKSFPEGVHYTNIVDINRFLDASISKVVETLFEAFILVFIVVFIFLQDFRSTLIPAISVPVAIVGTFFFLNLIGFSVNLLTLFALVLAIGIVVDDAIVVVEAVHAKLDSGYTSALKASEDAMHEISGAIVSITLVMAAVFLPVAFIGGSSGVFYKQFGLTLAIAIILSAVNALTLSPALCAILLKPKDEEQKHKKFLARFYTSFNVGFSAVTQKYGKSVGFLSKRKGLTVLIIVVFSAGLYGLMKTTPSGFVPEEDMGTIYINVAMPPATSLERTTVVTDKILKIAKSIPEVENVLRISGNNFIAGMGSSYGMLILELKPWEERKGVSNVDVIAKIMKLTAGITEAQITPISQPTITGFGKGAGFTFVLQDKGGHTTEEFYKVEQQFLEELGKHEAIQYATSSFNPNFPQYMIEANVPKIMQSGLTLNSIMNAMQIYYGGFYASNFNQFGKQYRIMVQADTTYRATPEGLNKIYVRTPSNAMAPISEFITLKRVYSSENVTRFNLFTSIDITGAPAKGHSTGEAIQIIKDVAAKTLPVGYGYEFSGISREEQSSGTQSFYVFILCIVFVYLLLCALYESYYVPFAVLLSLPVGLAGTFVFAKIFGINNNIYMQISLVMLIGLLAKNAILIVEYALKRRESGMGLIESAIDGAKARLRPILMTSFAMIFGLVPLMLAVGAGANGNRSIGTAAIGGMLFGTLFGILVIPALFVIFKGMAERFSIKKVKHPNEDSNN